MYKIIGDDQKEYGPVSTEQIRQWLAEGRLDARTKARIDGREDWLALGEMPEFASAFRRRQPWKCAKCGELIEPQFDTCWRCSTPRLPSSAMPATQTPRVAEATKAPIRWQVQFRVFRGVLKSWDALFAEAAAFASEIGQERLLSISHSEDQNDGVVTVWYWSPRPD